jgi:hypothetical protein
MRSSQPQRVPRPRDNPGAAAVQLFAEGVLPPIGAHAVTVTVGRHQLGPCLLEAVETGGATPIGTTIVLRFRCAGAGGP